MAEAASKDFRKGVAFRSQSLGDTEHAIFAGRLADRLGTQPAKGGYGNFLRQSVRSQGDVLGGMKWEDWGIIKAALALGGVDPNAIAAAKTPAERLALVSRINWARITLPALKAALGRSFVAPADWKRQIGIERLKRIKSAVEQGQQVTDPHERRLLGVWRTLEVQLGREILPAGPQSDLGLAKLPMRPADRKRFYGVLTGTNESVEAPLRLSAQSAYDYLTKYGVDVVSDDEATDQYLTRVLQDLHAGNAFIPSSARGSKADAKRWRDSAARSWGGFLPAARGYDPANAPGFAQWAAGMTTRGHKMRTNPSGRRVPYAFNEPEIMQRPADVPGVRYSIDTPSQEVPDEQVNAFYRAGTPEANAAVQRELVAPARDAVNWLSKQGWINDPVKIDDYTQDVVMGMLNRTGSIQNWRANVGFRRTTASMLARRFASQGWPSETKERTGRLGGGEDQPDTVDSAMGTTRGGEDEFSRIRGGAARARAAIQKAIASVLDIDTSNMGAADEEKFVDAIDQLSDPSEAARAMNVLDRLSARHSAALPQVRKAVERIQRHVQPLMTKVRGNDLEKWTSPSRLRS
jgi:hypothetical protein